MLFRDSDTSIRYILIGGSRGACQHTPPYRTQFFHFRIHFHWKVPTLEAKPPPQNGSTPPPYGKSWIRPWFCSSFLVWNNQKWTKKTFATFFNGSITKDFIVSDCTCVNDSIWLKIRYVFKEHLDCSGRNVTNPRSPWRCWPLNIKSDKNYIHWLQIVCLHLAVVFCI